MILVSINIKCYLSPTYIEKDMEPLPIENKIHVQHFSRNIEQIWKESYQIDYLNTDTIDDLFRGFIDYYFNGGGFDHIHNVIDTRSGRILKLENIPDKINDSVNGIDQRVRQNLRESIFAILDPFDYTYVPSKAFSLSYRHKDMLHIMAEFIEPQSLQELKIKKETW